MTCYNFQCCVFKLKLGTPTVLLRVRQDLAYADSLSADRLRVIEIFYRYRSVTEDRPIHLQFKFLVKDIIS